MGKIFSKIIISAVAVICLPFIIISPVSAQNTTAGGTYNFANQSGLNASANVAGYDTGTGATSLENVIGLIVYTLLGFIGVLFLILIIMGAFTWMTAEGNEEKVKKANGMVMNALIGLIITLAAYALSYFLISYFW